MLPEHRVSPWVGRLHVVVAGMFIVSSLLLGRFIHSHPLTPSFNWASASHPFLSVVSAAAVAFFMYMTITWSFTQALSLFVISTLISTVAELLGLSFGWTFGSFYSYHPDLAPRIARDLPMVIPLAWYVFSCIPLILLRPWVVLVRAPAGAGGGAIDQSGTLRSCPAWDCGAVETRKRSDYSSAPDSTFVVQMKRVIFCSVLLASCNLYLEPLSVYTKSWIWQRQGLYHGAPLSNLLGWFLVGLGVYSCFFSIQNRWHRRAPARSLRGDALLITLFLAWVTVALLMIYELLDSLTPLWLTLVVLAPPLCFRVLEERRESRMRRRDGGEQQRCL